MVEQLGEPECEALIAQASIGRVGFTDAAGPMILPVNYIVAEGFIAFRSDSTSMLVNVPLRAIAFEIDGWDGPTSAWSVVVRGHAREVTSALGERYEQLRSTAVPTFAPGPPVHWIVLEMDRISGRRITGPNVADESPCV